MQGKSNGIAKKRAQKLKYVSPSQLELPGFSTPFREKLSKENRWVKLAEQIPWDRIVNIYTHIFKSDEGREPLNGRIILGSIIIKHFGNFSDRETILQIQENMYMQYFLGYTSFTTEAPFSASLFVEIRKRLNSDLLGKINEIISSISLQKMFENEAMETMKREADSLLESNEKPVTKNTEDTFSNDSSNMCNKVESTENVENIEKNIGIEKDKELVGNTSTNKITHLGKLLVDATVAPQNITFPTDLKLLNEARKKSEELIDKLYSKELHGSIKPRTYRKKARQYFLNTVKKKRKSKKELYKSNRQQIRFLRRNIATIDKLLEKYPKFPLNHKYLKYLMVIRVVYDQQNNLHTNKLKIVEDRIVNIHQPHVRPIVRGKERNKTEFGCKLQIILVNGFAFIDKISWDSFNEGKYLLATIELYKKRFGFYPKEVLADKIYCNRVNRQELKELGIKLVAKPLGRPIEKAVADHIRPGERNPIEGKFGQAKIKYGLDKINAKLANTSVSWIASIFLVLNLVKLTRLAPPCLNFKIILKNIITIFYKYINHLLNSRIVNNKLDFRIFSMSY